MQVKREAEHFKSSVENRRKKSRASSKAATGEAKEQEQGKVQQPFLFHQKETESQIRWLVIHAFYVLTHLLFQEEES